jgi:hypothetical protein
MIPVYKSGLRLLIFRWCISNQCSGSVTFLFRFRLTGPAPDLALFVSDLQDANKIFFLSLSFNAYSFLKANLHWYGILLRLKVIKM